MLSERESGAARLRQAVKAYRAALLERTRERAPLDWAMTQNNLGTVLLRLDERGSDAARLKGAVRAYRMASEELTREYAPLDWAMTQINLGTASFRWASGAQARRGWRRRCGRIESQRRSCPATACRCTGRWLRVTWVTRLRCWVSGSRIYARKIYETQCRLRARHRGIKGCGLLGGVQRGFRVAAC